MKTLAPLAQMGKINPEASIRDSQSTIILAPIDKVWDILTDINQWPEWNPDINSVQFEALKEGGTFKWDFRGTNNLSTFRMIKKPEVLSWTAGTIGLKSIHVWTLEATDSDRTIVTVDESLQGFRTLFYSHQKLHSTLLNWLEYLKQRAEEKE